MIAPVYNRSDEVALDQGCYFDAAAADRVRFFFEKFLRHSKGQWASAPFILLDWQWERVIRPLFGWKNKDGTRRFRRAGVAVAKKNGKSTLLSGIGLYMLCADKEPGAEVYSAAADRDQASIIYNEAANMVEASDALITRCRVIRSKKMIEYGASWYKALSADVPTKEGLNIHCLLFDELHAQRGRELWDALKFGGASRRQPLIIWISTAGFDTASLCYDQWQYALNVQDGRTIDTQFLPYIVGATEQDDWKSEETWRKANPSYGATLNSASFEDDFKEAKSTPSNENSFKRYRLNLWTKQESRWIGVERWDQCKRDFTQDSLKKQKCWIGLDLSTTTDITAAVLLFKEAQKFRILPFFWLPKEKIAWRERNNKTRFDEWVRQGLIKVTDGDVIDYQVVRQDLNDLADIFRVREIAIDPWNASQIATDLQGDGFTVEFVRTGFYSISAAAKDFEKLVLAQQLEHAGHPVMDWMVGNVAVEVDASGNIKPSKAKSSEKIDGVVALIIALARAIKSLTKQSCYNSRGLTTL